MNDLAGGLGSWERFEDITGQVGKQGNPSAARSARELIPLAYAERLRVGESPVRVYRELCGMTPSELAAATGIELGLILAIEEAGRCNSPAVARRLAKVLGVIPQDLL